MSKVLPVLRIFDYNKTIEFYIDWLGFKIDWEHRPDNAPVYMQVSLRDVVLRLSEHHGDGSPGGRVCIQEFADVREYQKRLVEKNYKYNKPGLLFSEYNPGEVGVNVIDPVGNQIYFCEVEDENVKKG